MYLRKQQSCNNSGPALHFALKLGKMPEELWNDGSSFWRRDTGENAGS